MDYIYPMSVPANVRVRVGTASWSDPEFVRAGWYPPKLAAGRRLDYYAARFDMVELNSSFYAVPGRGQCARWAEATPEGFLFNVKVHRLLSRHATKPEALPPKFRDAVDTADRTGNVVLTPELERDFAANFLGEIAPLEQSGKLGALLLQLTPAFAPGRHGWEELDGLLQQLRGGSTTGKHPRRVVVEPRHRGWLEGARAREQTLTFLRDHGVTLAGVDAPAQAHFTILPPDFDTVTQPGLAYLRLHGRDAQAYTTGKTVAERFHYDYSDEELAQVGARVGRLAGLGAEEVHVVFNNNSRDFAPRAAERFREHIGQGQPPATSPEMTLF